MGGGVSLCPFFNIKEKYMKLNEIIQRIKKQSPEDYENVSLAEWCGVVNSINKRIYDNIISRHETDMKYEKISSGEDELPIPDEYTDIYVLFIAADRALARNEIVKYSNSMQAFNALYSRYADYINRTYIPKQIASIKLGVM